jgi:hypothetical protein
LDNIDIDLEILEDMCSDLEESAFLIDKNMDIIWINTPLRAQILLHLQSQNSDKEDLGIIEDATLIQTTCKDLFGGSIFEESKNLFKAGRLNRRIISHNHLSVKILSMPIKYGDKVMYLLNIIEEKAVKKEFSANTEKYNNRYNHDTLGKSSFQNNYDNNYDNNYGDNYETDYYKDYVKLLLNKIERPAIFLGLGIEMLVTNKHFDSLFKHSIKIKKFILDNVREKDFHEELKLMGYIVRSEDIKKKNLKIASIFILDKYIKKDVHKRVHTSIHKSVHANRSKNRSNNITKKMPKIIKKTIRRGKK